MAVIESSDFARIWRLGLEDIDCLTDDERVRFYAFAGSTLRFFEGARVQWRHWLSPEYQEWYESLAQAHAHDLYGRSEQAEGTREYLPSP